MLTGSTLGPEGNTRRWANGGALNGVVQAMFYAPSAMELSRHGRNAYTPLWSQHSDLDEMLGKAVVE
eukprot:4869172-Pyramimonas_sp.AAC.1